MEVGFHELVILKHNLFIFIGILHSIIKMYFHGIMANGYTAMREHVRLKFPAPTPHTLGIIPFQGRLLLQRRIGFP